MLFLTEVLLDPPQLHSPFILLKLEALLGVLILALIARLLHRALNLVDEAVAFLLLLLTFTRLIHL